MVVGNGVVVIVVVPASGGRGPVGAGITAAVIHGRRRSGATPRGGPLDDRPDVEGMGEGLGDEAFNVTIHGPVVDPVPVAPTGDQPGPPELGQVLRHGSMSRTNVLGQLADRVLTMQQRLDESEPSGIGDQLQGPDCLLDVNSVRVFNCMRIHAYGRATKGKHRVGDERGDMARHWAPVVTNVTLRPGPPRAATGRHARGEHRAPAAAPLAAASRSVTELDTVNAAPDPARIPRGSRERPAFGACRRMSTSAAQCV